MTPTNVDIPLLAAAIVQAFDEIFRGHMIVYHDAAHYEHRLRTEEDYYNAVMSNPEILKRYRIKTRKP